MICPWRTIGSASEASSIARPTQNTRPPRASTPQATATSHSSHRVVIRSGPSPTMRIADTGASDSSILTHSARGATSWTSAVAKMIAKPMSTSTGRWG